MKKLRIIIQITSTLLIGIYPFIVFLGLTYFSISIVSLLIITIAILRYLALYFSPKEIEVNIDHNTQNKASKNGNKVNTLKTLMIISVIIAIFSLISQSLNWMLFYPIIVNLILLFNFSYSLISPPSMIERFARLKEKELPEAAIIYTKNVTKIWCLFFLINGSIAFLTTFNLEYWTLYNGFISYLLIAILLGGEFLYRKWKIQRKTLNE